MDFIRRGIDALRSALAKRAGLLRTLALVGSVVAVVAAVPNPAEACGISDPLSCVAMIFVKIFQLLTALMGWILVIEVEALIRVAQFFNFVSPGPTAVQIGWVVTRDLANMFFIVVLLIIAFGTILGSSTYHYSKNLPRLLIMAVVINFSKTICGIFIDMGQVVMLTFVNGFKETAAGNFMNAYQINKLLALGNGDAGTYDFGMVVAMMFAFILATIAVCVTLVLLIIVLFRVVMLWILIILSPIAFLTSAIPRGGDYYAKWWGEFKKYIITGPIIAFFMWLALASVQGVGPGGFASQGFPATYAGAGEAAAAANATVNGPKGGRIPTEAGTADTIMNMVIAICIMFAGLKYASDSGVAGAGVAKSVRSGLEKTGRAIATGGLKMAAQPILTGGGRQLAKVPLVGGLGRAAVLTGEKWKKERQAGLEKRFGGAEDLARLSPGAFNRNLNSLSKKGNLDDIDKKRLSSMLDVGLKNPGLAASMGKSGDGAFALNSLIRSSKGKSLQDAASTMMTDKNAVSWAKNDDSFVRSAYDKISKEAETDPNMKKTLGEFEQKFAPQLSKMTKDPNADYDEKTNPYIVDQEKLRNIVPKMSSDDIGGIEKAEDLALFMPHMTGGQMRKVMQDGKPKQMDAMKEAFDPNRKDKDGNPAALMKQEAVEKLLTDKGVGAGDLSADHALGLFSNPTIAAFALKKSRGDAKARGELMANPVRAAALTQASRAEFDAAMKGTPDPNNPKNTIVDPGKVTSALVDAIAMGQISAAEIKGNAVLQGMVVNRMNTGDLAKSVNRSSSPQALEAAQQVMAQVMASNPEKAKNMRRQDQYQDILPTQAMVEAAGAEEKLAQAAEVSTEAVLASARAAEAQTKQLEGLSSAMENAKKQLSSMAGSMANNPNPTPATEALYGRMKSAVERLEGLSNRKKQVESERSGVEKRISGGAQGNELEALKKQLASINETLRKTDQDIIKGLGALKG